MTTQRIKIAANSTSPFRVSASGVDVTGATFDGLLFDGNQKPLRIYSTGYFAATIRHVATTGFVVGTAGPFGPSTPSGTYPLFTIMSKTAWVQSSNFAPRTVGAGYGGGAFDSSNRLQGLTFATDGPDNTVNFIYLNYIIFRNYG